MPAMGRHIRARLRRYFVSGFFIVIPIGLSVLVVWSFIGGMDRTVAPVIDAALGFHIPGLGLIAAALLILGAGFLASHVVGERLLEIGEDVLGRIPVFKWVYGTIKQVTEAFSPANKTAFQSVVFIEYPRPGVYSLGFVTAETTAAPGKKLTAVYVPTNHVYIGDLIFVPKEGIIETELTVQQGIQVMLSAGAASAELAQAKKK
jgi:uncharacterized membrane protein